MLVRQSNRLGRPRILRVCLAGATASSFLIAFSSSLTGIIAGRLFAGIFAASVPVAQAAAADMVPSNLTALALSRVAAASQCGIIVGPAFSAILIAVFGFLGLPQSLQLHAVFASSGVLSICVLVFGGFRIVPAAGDGIKDSSSAARASERAQSIASLPLPHITKSVQPILRLIALAVGWSLTLSVYGYALLAPRFLGYEQAQLSATFSVGAAVTILVQLVVFPRLVARVGEPASCTLGLSALSVGLVGAALVRTQPAHSGLYLLNRAGSGVADISIATLVSQASPNKEMRARNLGLIQSTRAAARIVTPLLSGKLFEASCGWAFAPGSLPYLVLASLVMSLTPLPLVIGRLRTNQKAEQR